MTQTATGLAAGTYSVVVTDANNCTANISVTLSEPATPISLSIVGYDVSCFSGNDGSLDLTALGGTAPSATCGTTLQLPLVKISPVSQQGLTPSW